MELTEILQFEKWIELTAMGVMQDACQNVYHSRQVDTNASPRIAFKATIGPAKDVQKLTINTPPGYIYSAYEGKLVSIVTTNRTTDAAVDEHNPLVAQVRLRMCDFYVQQFQESQTAILPILIFDIRPAENDDDEQDTENLDNTKLTHAFTFSINTAALPVNL